MQPRATYDDLRKCFGPHRAKALLLVLEDHAGITTNVVPICPEKRLYDVLNALDAPKPF